MSRAHVSSMLQLKDVLVPTDNKTVGLWHFDKHMYSTNIIKPTINTASIAPGKFGNSVLVQEATDNAAALNKTSWLSNLSIGSSSDISVAEGIIRIARLSEHRYRATVIQDVTHLRLSITSFLTWPANVPAILSAVITDYYEAPGTLGRFGLGRYSYGGADLNAHDGLGYKQYIMHEAVERSASVAVRSGDYLVTAGTYIEWENLQLVFGRDYATPFVASSIPNQQLIYNNVAPPQTISCYFKLASVETRAEGHDRIILRYRGSNATISSWQIYIPGGNKDVYFSCRNAQQGLATKNVIVYNSNVDIYDQNWHFLCARFDGTQMTLTIDDVTKTLNDYPYDGLWTTPPIFPLQELGIGCPVAFDRSANVYIDELRLDSITYSLEETQAWRISDKPFYDPYDYSITAD